MGQKETQIWEPGTGMIARLDILVWRYKVQVCAEVLSLAALATDWRSLFALSPQKLWKESMGAGSCTFVWTASKLSVLEGFSALVASRM